MTLRRCIVMLMLVLAVLSARSQSLHGYSFSTGVSASKWITLTNPDTIRTFNNSDVFSPLVELDFPFGFFGSRVHSLSVSKTGMIACNRTYTAQIPLQISLARLSQTYPDPLIFINGQSDNTSTMAVWQTVGIPGNRTMVCEITRRLDSDTTAESHFQFQVDESTSTIRFVYGTHTDSGNQMRASGKIGFTGNYSKYISISPISHMASSSDVSPNGLLSWPGNYRYYQFTPTCTDVLNIRISHVSHNSARISWSPFSQSSLGNVNYYIVRYGRPDEAYIEQVVWDTSISITGLQSSTLYNVQVVTLCRNGQTSDTVPIHFRTVFPSCSNIPFTSLWDDFVECRTGSFTMPSTQVGVVDSGYQSDMSRHTVHFDTAERDANTGYQLRTIPIGHCSSVRLGNTRIGSEQESVTYTLQVDTNNYDLLLLRYAIVAQNPNHRIDLQPHALFTVSDSVDSLIGPCYSANFIPGSLTGWIPADDLTVWRDWSVYGMALSDFHGQTIRVTISNFDCGGDNHWGYLYFTLEGFSKRLISTVCGSNTENTFYAPQGFDYRWYKADNPSVTLSTSDSLHVTTSGLYYCQATYQLADNSCSFTMATYAGMRYPVARFSSVIDDSCGAVCHFVNQSVVATDSAHTQLTSEPCERYLWRFSDGTTDSAINLTHTFGNGTHTVTLIAMLANGSCMDSVSQTFTVDIPSDTTYMSACWGTPYQFGDMVVTESGQYSYVDSCVEHILNYTALSSAPTTIFDTICMGDTLFWGDLAFFVEGTYTLSLVNPNGCDSIVNLQLNCQPSYRIEVGDTLPVGAQYSIGDTVVTAPCRCAYRMSSGYGCDSVLDIRLSCVTNKDTTICTSSLPFVWDSLIFNGAGHRQLSYINQAGTDSIVTYTLRVREMPHPQIALEQSCDSDRYFIVELGGGYHYIWHTDSTAGVIDTIVTDSLYYIHVIDPAYYYVQIDYPDAPSCPAVDSFYLDSSAFQPMVVDFSIYPENPSSENLIITLTDLSQNMLNREWYVNGQLWPESGTTITVDLSLSDDSIEVCLVRYRKFCQLSVCKKVGVEWQSIYFPNAFTPDGDVNNRFTAVGWGIAEFEMWVYDRRGALMYHSTDLQQGWDGISNGIKCRQEVYTYRCRYRLKHDQGYQSHTGTVLLLR